MLNKKFSLSLLIVLVCSALITVNYSDLFTKEDVKQLQYTGKEDHSIRLEKPVILPRAFNCKRLLIRLSQVILAKKPF